ncbi:MAG: 2Fe-2S ferredoxin-like protein [Neisseriaceae bacterium]|nr:2Fe-2S ferredoxin-like protein [Neisseriaceae bacterium]
MLIQTTHTHFQLSRNDNLLDKLEATGHDVSYQCRNGYCGACRIKMLSGSVSYAKQPLAMIGKDEILPCCCQVQEPLKLDIALRSEQQDLFIEELFDK